MICIPDTVHIVLCVELLCIYVEVIMLKFVLTYHPYDAHVGLCIHAEIITLASSVHTTARMRVAYKVYSVSNH